MTKTTLFDGMAYMFLFLVLAISPISFANADARSQSALAKHKQVITVLSVEMRVSYYDANQNNIGTSNGNLKITFSSVKSPTKTVLILKKVEFTRNKKGWPPFHANEKPYRALTKMIKEGVSLQIALTDSQIGIGVGDKFVRSDDMSGVRGKIAKIASPSNRTAAALLLGFLKYMPIFHSTSKMAIGDVASAVGRKPEPGVTSSGRLSNVFVVTGVADNRLTLQSAFHGECGKGCNVITDAKAELKLGGRVPTSSIEHQVSVFRVLGNQTAKTQVATLTIRLHEDR